MANTCSFQRHPHIPDARVNPFNPMGAFTTSGGYSAVQIRAVQRSGQLWAGRYTPSSTAPQAPQAQP